MDDSKRAEFERKAAQADGTRLRHWNDPAKAPGLGVLLLEHYRMRIAKKERSLALPRK